MRGLFAIVLLIASAGAEAQEPESRIDTTPQVILRPPKDDRTPVTSRPGDVTDVRVLTNRVDRDRRLDLDFELKDRRDAFSRDEGGIRDYLVAGACVLACGVVLAAFLFWVKKRRGD